MRALSFLIGLFVLLGILQAQAATEVSITSGNIGTAGTWALIEPNSFTNSNVATLSINSSATYLPGSPTTFTVGGTTTVAGLGIKLASIVASPSGTITCRIETGGSQVTNAVTGNISLSSLQLASSATNDDGGWVFMAFASSATLATSTNYGVQCQTSVTTQVTLQAASATQISVALYTATNQAPVAGDFFFVNGIWSSGGSITNNTVTVNTTANTSYGNASTGNTSASPSLSVSNGGTLAFANSASTNYLMEFAGVLSVYNGGTFNIGTAGSDIPSTSSATLTLNSSVEGDTGIFVHNGGTMNVAGDSGGRSVVKTKLTSAASGGATSLTTADSTGWLSGDSIYIASSTTASSVGMSPASYLGDLTTLSSGATGTNVPVSAITNSHTAQQLSYTSSSTGILYSMNMYVDVVLMTRNVIIQGSGSTTNGYLYFQRASNFAAQWVEFLQISGLNAGKRGIEADTSPADNSSASAVPGFSSGSFTLTNFIVRDSHASTMVLSPNVYTFGGTQGAYVTIQHGIFYNDLTTTSAGSGGVNYVLGIVPPSNSPGVFSPYWKIDDVTFILCANGASSVNKIAFFGGMAGQFTNISFTGNGNSTAPSNISFAAPYGGQGSTLGGGGVNTWGPITSYANMGYSGMNNGNGNGGGGVQGTISGYYVWHEVGRFQYLIPAGQLVIDPFYIVTSAFGIYNSAQGSTLTVRNGVMGWDALNNEPALTLDSITATQYFDNMEICPVGSISGITFLQCNAGIGNLYLQADLTTGGTYNNSNAHVFLRNSSMFGLSTNYPTNSGQEAFYGPHAYIVQDCAACSPVKHGAWIYGGFLSYDTAITHTSGYSLRMTPRTPSFPGYISTGSGVTTAGNVLTVSSGFFPTQLADFLFTSGANFIPGTKVVTPFISGTQANVSLIQSVGSSASPVRFQSYFPTSSGGLPRLQSAPDGMGTQVAVPKNGTASVCVWVRPSVNTDAAPTWGGSAVTYSGDNPRLVVRQNPYMGVQADTALSTNFTPALSAGTWSQACATTPVAPSDGLFEMVVDADQPATVTTNPGGWVNVAEWSCAVGCSNINGGQFWWNGVPAGFSVPVAGGRHL